MRGAVGVLPRRTRLVASVTRVNQEKADVGRRDVARVTIIKLSVVARRTAVSAVGALVVRKVAELIVGTGNGTEGAAEEIGDAVDALTGLTVGERGAGGAGRGAVGASVIEGVLELARVAARAALRLPDLQIVTRLAARARSVPRGEAALTARGALQTLPHRSVGVEVVGTRAQTRIVEEKVVLCAGRRRAVFCAPVASHTDRGARLTRIRNRGSDELTVGTARVADSVSDVFVVNCC